MEFAHRIEQVPEIFAKGSSNIIIGLIAPKLARRITGLICFALGYMATGALGPDRDTKPTVIVVKPNRAPENPGEDRDLTEYEFAGHLDRCESLPQYGEMGSLPSQEEQLALEKKCENLRINAREILYENWRAKIKTYAVVEYHGEHCPAPDHIFVEPGTNGHWRIVVRRHAYGVFPGFNKTMYDRIAVDLRRIRPSHKDYRYENGREILVFRDENGDEILYL